MLLRISSISETTISEFEDNLTPQNCQSLRTSKDKHLFKKLRISSDVNEFHQANYDNRNMLWQIALLPRKELNNNLFSLKLVLLKYYHGVSIE